MKRIDEVKCHTKNTVFIKFFLNMFLILIIPYLILFSIYYSLNSKIKHQTYERCAGLLENSAQKVEMLFDNMDQISLYLVDNMDIVNYLNLKSQDLNQNLSLILKAQENMTSIRLGNSDILNIQIFSALNETLIDSFTNVINMERYYGKYFVLDGVNQQEFEDQYFFLQSAKMYQQKVMTLNGTTQEVLIYNNIFSGKNINQKNNRILFYIKSKSLLGLYHLSEFADDSSLYLADEQGHIILSDHQKESDLSQIDIEHLDGKSGYKNLVMNGKKMFLTYYKSDERDWICLETIPLSSVLMLTEGFRRTMLALLVLAILSGVVLMILIAKKLSRPIAEAGNVLGRNIPLDDFVGEITKLVENNTELKGKMQQQMSIIKTEAFYQLLIGGCTDSENMKAELDKIQICQDAALYTILLLNCNDMDIDAALEDISAQKVYLEKLIREQNFKEVQEIYQIDYERMIILMASYDSSIHQMRILAEDLIRNVSDALAQNVVYSISVGGDIVNDIEKIPKAFIHVQQALSIPQNVFGTNKIQWYDRLKRYKEIEGYEHKISREENVSIQNQVLVDKIKNYISENYNNPQLSLSLIGEEFYITEVYLSKLFKRATGDNFSKYLEGIRIRKAKELLEMGYKVADVGKEIGYNSPQVFRRAYKRYYGCNPSEQQV